MDERSNGTANAHIGRIHELGSEADRGAGDESSKHHRWHVEQSVNSRVERRPYVLRKRLPRTC